MEDHYPADVTRSASLEKATYASGGAGGGRVGYGAPSVGGLAKDMPLTAQLSDTLSGQIERAEAILRTLLEAHQRVFGPLPPSDAGANATPVPQPDTVEAHLTGAARGLSDRLYAIQHVATCVANRL